MVVTGMMAFKPIQRRPGRNTYQADRPGLVSH